MVDGDNLPEELPEKLIKSLIDNLNISDETNGMFSDSIQENIPGDVVSFRFEAAKQRTQQPACTCERPWLPIGGEGCERCGGWVDPSHR